MTASELLALLGRAWFQLLIYPGGLTVLALAALLAALRPGRPWAQPESGVRRTLARGLRALQEGLRGTCDRTDVAALSALAAPWLGVALLPLPGAPALARPLDLVGTLALLEWPLLLALRAGLREPSPALRSGAALRLAAALNGYPPLLLALLLLAGSGGSLQIDRLVRLPESAGLASAALHWFGACALLLALPPVLGIGPFGPTDDQRPTTTDESGAGALKGPWLLNSQFSILNSVALRLRAVGLAGLAALPWCAALEQRSVWLAPLPLLLAGPLLWAAHCLTRRTSRRRWAQAYLALDAALIVALGANG